MSQSFVRCGNPRPCFSTLENAMAHPMAELEGGYFHDDGATQERAGGVPGRTDSQAGVVSLNRAVRECSRRKAPRDGLRCRRYRFAVGGFRASDCIESGPHPSVSGVDSVYNRATFSALVHSKGGVYPCPHLGERQPLPPSSQRSWVSESYLAPWPNRQIPPTPSLAVGA